MANDFDDRVILGLLLEHAPAHLSTGELEHELGGAAVAVRVADALAALRRTGLAHGPATSPGDAGRPAGARAERLMRCAGPCGAVRG